MGSVEFRADGTAELANSDGSSQTVRYALDTSHQPWWLDLGGPSGGEPMRSLLLAELTPDGELHLEGGPDPTVRPAAFSDASIFLRRWSADAPSSRIVGDWTGPDAGAEAELVFRADGTAAMGEGDDRYGFPGDTRSILRWELDPSHDPWWLDIVVLDAVDGALLARIPMIAEIAPDGRLRILGAFDDLDNPQRPTSFDNDDVLVLTRVE